MAQCSGKFVARIVLGAVIVLVAPSVTFAQSETERVGARAAAEAGLAAFGEGRYNEAYELLDKAETLVHALPHLLYMARASEKQGQLVRARELYLKIGREQLVAGAPRAFLDAQQSAERERAAVEARLPYVTISLEGARSSEVRVTLDEREVPSVLLGVPFPIDPGTHVIVANGQGIGSEPATVNATEGARERIALKITTKVGATVMPAPPPTTTEPAARTPVVVGTTSTQPSTLDQGTEPERSAGKSPVLAYTALGMGAVGVGVGTVFLLQRNSTRTAADEHFYECTLRVCSDSERESFLDEDKKAATYGTLSLVGFGVGAAAVSTGVYLLLTRDSKPKNNTARLHLIPYVGLGNAGAVGSF